MRAVVLAAMLLLAAASASAAPPRWVPRPGASFQIQLDGEVDLSVRARVYEIDGFENDAAVVEALHARGRRAICYVNAGAWEAWRPDRDAFPPALLGRRLSGYPDERWIDIRRIDLLAPIIRSRFQMCRDKGFDAIEADNVNGFTNRTGFPLTGRVQLRYNRWLAATAHGLGLSIALKNDVEQAKTLARTFDFSVSEECFQFRECRLLKPFLKARKAVFDIEYALPPGRFCARARELRITAIRKTLDLGPYRVTCGR